MRTNEQQRRRLSSQAGFTLVELVVVVGVVGTIAAMAIMMSPGMLLGAKADSGISQVLDAFRSAREVAVSQRRNVEIKFIGNNAVQTVRRDIGTDGVQTGTTILRTVELENRMQFRLMPGQPDTPDLFGRSSSPVSFGASTNRMFTSEGTFVDANGDVLNGTLFMAIENEPNSARAVTVLGATGLIRDWRWDGRKWSE